MPKPTLNPDRYDQLMAINRDYLESEVAELLCISIETLLQTLYKRKYSALFATSYKLGPTYFFRNAVVKKYFNRNTSLNEEPVTFGDDKQMKRILNFQSKYHLGAR